MSNNKMLIDATHPEETRVVVLRDNRVEEFDYESAARKLLRGSIYLAKITRVEPSLQAAFVDYGGNRHGFLAFSEIHPDYYQIPHADRQALLDEEIAEQQRLRAQDEAEDEDDVAEDEAETDAPPDDDADDAVTASAGDDAKDDDRGQDSDDAEAKPADDDLIDAIEKNAIDVTDILPPEEGRQVDDTSANEPEAETPSPDTIALDATPSSDDVRQAAPPAAKGETADDLADATHVHIYADPESSTETHDAEDEDESDDDVESINDDTDEADDVVDVARGAADNDDDEDEAAAEDAPRAKQRSRPARRARHYKIQEVVKRRQIVLIQVVKEERGNKGAALTTYLSLAGRYTVLMPNTARGGGISRKITNVQDRKRLKAIAQELDVPEGMGLIIRTAGAARTKQEIKRDFEYLLRLWENVRSLTLESTAPSLVYEEGNLIKRSIRDLYTKDTDEIIVAGEDAYKEAKSFMKMLMPSHAKNVILHNDDQSLFSKYRIEQQLNAMFSPVVQLRSGGYLVINQTEALVAVDVNSGKSTREFSIEETALNTNLEAAEELSRQLKLRDLAGLIVVDFIDMDEKRNNRAVERKLKDCLKTDRARIQLGRISHFGLLEMSRQRLRTGVLEGSTMPCVHCQGSGIVRSTESVALAVLRGLEDNYLAGKIRSCVALCSADVALYLLNQKRAFIQELERRYGVVIHVRASEKHQGANFAIEWMSEDVEQLLPAAAHDAVNIDAGFEPRRADNDDQSDDEQGEGRSRRRRRRGGRRDENRQGRRDSADDAEDESAANPARAASSYDGQSDETGAREDGERHSRRSRRRGRRGGRRHREQQGDAALAGVAVPGADQPDLSNGGETASRNNGDGDQPAKAANDTQDETTAATATANATPETSSEPGHAAQSSLMAHLERLDDSSQPSNANAVDVAEATGDAESVPEPSEPTAPEPTIAETAHQPEPVNEPAIAATEEAAEAEPAAAVEAPPADGADRTARAQPVASEPVIQHVVVGPNGAEAATPAEGDEAETATEPQKPARRGWWQRQFGG
jgi:ribonuclease E